MAIQTKRTFDLEGFTRAVESGWDVEALLPLYHDDAEYVVVDKDHPPSAPRVLRGAATIGEYLKAAASLGVASRVEHPVLSEERAALAFNCRYPDGTRVLCHSILELEDGLIVRHSDVQAWDE